jgi:type IV pilus assembly protein PilC
MLQENPKEKPQKAGENPVKTQVKPPEKPPVRNRKVKVAWGVSLKEKIFFAKYLSIMIVAGIPLRDALSVIMDQTKNKKFARILDWLIREVENGQYLSAALGAFPRIFDYLFLSLVRVGEESGQLSENLNYISVQLDRADSLKKKVRGALIYPAIILVGVIAVAAFLTFFTLPQLLPIFVSLKVKLPPTTQFLFDFSKFITRNWPYILGSLITLVTAFRFLLMNNKFRYMVHRAELSIPLFGPLLMNTQVTRICQVMATLLTAGVDVVRGLEITAESAKNLVYREELRRIAGELKRQGVNIADCLNQKYFPPFAVQMIRVGEKTGKLDDSFRFIAEFLTKEIDDQVNNMTTIIEPVLLLIMGVVVGFVAISVITPIYKITEGIHR